MIPIGKSIDINRKTIIILSPWKRKMNITQGSGVQISIKSNCIILKRCHQSTTEITSTVGRGGAIYITVEVRNHFHLKGITEFELFVDEENCSIIICQKKERHMLNAQLKV